MEVGVILMREPRVILTKADAARVCAHMCVRAPIASPELHSKHAADVPDVYINYLQLASWLAWHLGNIGPRGLLKLYPDYWDYMQRAAGLGD